MTDSGAHSRLFTLVFTDLADSTALKSQKGDQVVGELIARHREHVTKGAADFEGRIIDWAGDGCFLTFETPSAAVRFALRLQSEHAGHSDLPGLRIGVHMGEVTEKPGPGGGDSAPRIEGLAVDVTARVSGLALPGQILLSGPVFDSARQRLDADIVGSAISWCAHGSYELKGVDDPVDICEVGSSDTAPLSPPEGSEKAHRAVTPSEEETLGWRPAAGHTIPGRDHWVLEEQLGLGGFGEVWLASHETTHAKRVFKFCFQADRVKGLKREVVLFRLLKESLGERNDIARILDWDFENPPYFLEAEYTEGGDLRDWSDSQGGIGNIELEIRLEIVAQVADALDAAHTAGVLHKDLKPTNVLISVAEGAPRAILTDFGIGLLTDPEALKRQGITATGLTQTLSAGSSTSTSGTGMYLAPEIFEGKAPSERSDIYALGVLLYQIAIGDFSRAMAPGWEREVDDDLLREDIALCVDGIPENRPERSGEVAERLRAMPERRRSVEIRALRRRRRSRLVLGAGAVTLIGMILAATLTLSRSRERVANESWAREEAVPEAMALVEEERFVEAFELAMEAAAFIPDDPLLEQLIEASSQTITLTTTPEGAEAFYRPYGDVDAEWQALGRSPLGLTPVEGTRVPRGAFEWRIEKDGFERAEGAVFSLDAGIDVTLAEANSLPPGMVRVPDTGFSIELRDLEPLHGYPLREYYIDKFEVTNREFLEFVRAGGYETEDYWTHPFIDRFGGELDREAAMEIFRDATDQAGPASWEAGTYTEGEDDYPVTGVSWYEAAAFAQFKGKRLPTFFHWFAAATGEGDSLDPSFAEVLIPASNFSGRGPSPVGAHPGIAPYGSYDMAGNVKEWVFNASGNLRFILGGAWNEGALSLTSAYPESPLDRHFTYGFRCAIYPGEEEPPELLFRSIRQTAFVDYEEVTPASDEVFEFYKNQFSYDATDLEPEIVQLESTSDLWTKEKINFNAAYGGERMFAYLYLPTRVDPPYQTIVYFPGNGAVSSRSSAEAPQFQVYDFIIKSGRAVIVPVYKSTYERHDHLRSVLPNTTRDYTDHILMWVRDVMRSIDYLETRDDILMARLGYFGYSWGAGIAPLVLAVEERLHLGVLVTGGFPLTRGKGEMRVFHYAPRVKVPVLMLNGEYDSIFPLESSQRPLFRMLGTSEEDKQHLTYPTGHSVPRSDIIKETLAWLDKYFGPVRRVRD